MKSWQLLILAIVVSALCTSVKIEAASISVSIDGVSTSNVPLTEVPKPGRSGNVFIIGESEEEPFMFETENGRIILGGVLDPDPVIQFGASVTDFGAASTFGFTLILPLAPLVSNPSLVKDSFSGSVANGSGSGVTLTAVAPLAGVPTDTDGVTEMQVFTLSDDGGATWENVGLDLGPSATIPLPPGNAAVYGPFNEGFIATIPGGPWTHMRADISFMLSGGNDVFSFGGAKVLVPEPGAMVLALVSLAALCFCHRQSVSRR